MKSGERETYLPGSGYNEGSSNNGSGHGGFPLLMFVPFSLFFSGYWLVRPLFLGLFVPCSCFQSLSFLFSCSRSLSSAFPWFSFCSRYLLCFSFFACVCPLSLGLFFLFLLALTCSVFLCLFFCSWLCFGLNFPLFSPLIFLFLFWVYFSVLSPQKLPFFL